ncbi:MAG: hypothetical protein ACYTAS_20740 [Planctomycetota bacterium]|jgi:hypothetical protein
MKRFIAAACIGLVASTAGAAVSAHVYRADEQTPLPWADPNVPDLYRDIMVGTRLAIFISSDEDGGGVVELRHPWENSAIGSVCGRDEDPNTPGYEASVLPAAGGRNASVRDFIDPIGVGLHLACDYEAVAGEWFVVDYHAKAIGVCDLTLYAVDPVSAPSTDGPPNPSDVPPGQAVPVQVFSFHHVPSRDLSLDDVVDFVDFAVLANEWRVHAPDPNQLEATAAADPNTPPSPDLNVDAMVDTADLVLFCAYWLERTDVNQPAADPNALGGAEQ